MSLESRYLLRGARLIDSAHRLDRCADLLIDEGRIVAIGERASSASDCHVMELSGYLVLPALTDLHVAVRDPGQEYKETFQELVTSASAGGYTCLVASPDTHPVNDSGPVAEHLIGRAERDGRVALYPLGAITRGLQGEQLAEIHDLVSAGVVGFSDGGRPIERSEVVRRALEYLVPFDLPLFLRCEDTSLAADGVMHEGLTATTLGLKGIPTAAEELAVYRALTLARLTRGRVHLTQLSAGASIELVRIAKSAGVRVTCDVSPHHLWFTDHRVRGYDTAARVAPPLRDSSDRQALIQGLNDGTIDAIASGHSPQSLLEKEVEFEAAHPGATSLELTLPAVLKLVEEGSLERDRALDALIRRPAQIVGLPAAELEVGAAAELVIVSPTERLRVDAARLKGPCRSTPFGGMMLGGQVWATFHRGRPVFSRERDST